MGPIVFQMRLAWGAEHRPIWRRKRSQTTLDPIKQPSLNINNIFPRPRLGLESTSLGPGNVNCMAPDEGF